MGVLVTFHFFDPKAEFAVTERRLPHWEQPGVLCFATWRTADSMPRAVIESWIRERDQLLSKNGIDPRGNWRTALEARTRSTRDRLRDTLRERWEDRLDECHGACVLRRPALSRIVADSLLHFDGERYVVSDFVVMPNHVHLLFALEGESRLLPQLKSWKRYTATWINRELGRKGEFWQVEGFDHLVRSPEQFGYHRRYIADNPRRARLRSGEFALYQHQPLEDRPE